MGVATAMWTLRSRGPLASQMANALAAQRPGVTRLCPCLDLDNFWTIERFEGDVGAQSCGRHRNRRRAVEVVALTLKDRILLLNNLDVEIACRAVARTNLALASQLDASSGVDSTGTFTVSVRRVRTRPSPAQSGRGRHEGHRSHHIAGTGAVITWPRNER